MLKKLSSFPAGLSGLQAAHAPTHEVARQAGPSITGWTGAVAICLASLACATSAQAAGFTVAAGDTVSLTTTMNLDCQDLVVNGTLNTGGQTITNIGNVIIGAGGVFNASGTNLQITRSWQNSGAFSGQGSTVTATNTCANTSTSFSGTTTFGNLSATIAGHALNFAAGSEQKVAGQLSLSGVTLKGTGGTAFLTLLPGGSQNIGAVAVDGVDASRGQHLAPTGTNQITGNAKNWFKDGGNTPEAVKPVPANGPAGLALMGGLLMLAAGWLQRTTRKNRRDTPRNGR